MKQRDITFELKATEEHRGFGFRIVDCPACGKETLDGHFICPNCDWEYDGITEENEYSACNRWTVGEYRKNIL